MEAIQFYRPGLSLAGLCRLFPFTLDSDDDPESATLDREGDSESTSEYIHPLLQVVELQIVGGQMMKTSAKHTGLSAG